MEVGSRTPVTVLVLLQLTLKSVRAKRWFRLGTTKADVAFEAVKAGSNTEGAAILKKISLGAVVAILSMYTMAVCGCC